MIFYGYVNSLWLSNDSLKSWIFVTFALIHGFLKLLPDSVNIYYPWSYWEYLQMKFGWLLVMKYNSKVFMKLLMLLN